MKFTLVYDSGCGPCTRFKNTISFLDKRRRMRYLGLGDAEQEGLLDSVPRDLRHRSFHLVSPGGQVSSGPAAFPRLVRLLPVGRFSSTLLARSVPASWAATHLYVVLSRLHEAGACSYSGPAAKSMSISTSMSSWKGPNMPAPTGV